MKRTLILTSMFSYDLYDTYRKALELVDENTVVLSPVVLFKADPEVERTNFFLKLIAATKHMEELMLLANDIKSKNHVIIIGPTLKDIEFDEIISLKGNVIDVQKSYLKELVKYINIEEYYDSSAAKKDFTNLEDLFAYLKGEINHVIQQ